MHAARYTEQSPERFMNSGRIEVLGSSHTLDVPGNAAVGEVIHGDGTTLVDVAEESWSGWRPTTIVNESEWEAGRATPYLVMVTRTHNHARNSKAHAAALDRWEAEGGTIEAPWSACREWSGHLSDEEAHILKCLGAAVLSRWNGLPTRIQQELFEHSFDAGLPRQAARLKKQIARFLHNHKDDAGGAQ